MSVVKRKPKYLSQPITTNTNYTMNQSELKGNTCNPRQAREKRVRASRDWFEFNF